MTTPGITEDKRESRDGGITAALRRTGFSAASPKNLRLSVTVVND